MPRPRCHATLPLSLLLTLILLTSCGPTERRNESSGYEGPAQAENEAPDGGSDANAARIALRYLMLEATLGFPYDTRVCRCSFEALDYESESQCRSAEIPSETEVDAVQSCLLQNADALPERSPDIDDALQLLDRIVTDFESCMSNAPTTCIDEADDAQEDCFYIYESERERDLMPYNELLGSWLADASEALDNPECEPR